MKNYLVLAIIVFFSLDTLAQVTDTIFFNDIKMDILKTPTNPAFILMNTTPTEIAEPGTLPEFYISIQNASENFTGFPNNYAFTITPFWWGKKARMLSFDDDFDTVNNSLTFYKTLSFSGGIVQGIDDEKMSRYGLGFHSTLLRGKINKQKKEKYLENLKKYHERFYGDINIFFGKSPEYVALEESRIVDILEIKNIDSLISKLDTIINSRRIDSLNRKKDEIIQHLSIILSDQDLLKDKLANNFNEQNKYTDSNSLLDESFNEMNDREGLKWDIGGGLAFNSIENKIDSTKVYRIGLWSNIGGKIPPLSSQKSNFEFYALIRYLHYNEVYYTSDDDTELVEGLNVFDFGGKLQYEILNKFSAGLEGVYRAGVSKSIYNNTYKINGLLQYRFDSNRLIYASLGNNFNDENNQGADEFFVTFGLNIGFGGNVDVYTRKF